ncbi:RICIN domain-containing protein [Streptomyces sp. B3I8]|uniref:RICIN domain-containing protein n=1 Tax=Streptomyces sp. B3I8 TaxID=3042303 RepID=UPI0027860DD5|nr:RICIN domain-containing protein [Streptomyces sp. B3I8]MDQ0790981.1 DNA-directed RNA polymerase specialized sigma24 family protein [Streptomyces sp. B3I8]
MNDGAVPHSPEPGRPREVPDAELAAELKKSGAEGPVHRPVEELLARHGEAVYTYARLCVTGAHPAGMLTTSAFSRLFENAGRQGGPTAAWRPALLVTVGRIAGEWDTDHRRDMLHPELRSGAGSAAARLRPTANRRLVSAAFQRLAEPARCLLWHMEVEREEAVVPAALLGIDTGDVPVRLARARARLRDACLEIHRESAPRDDCRRFARLLDVALRRGDRVLDPDLLFHMDGCAHCRGAAEQLDGFDRRLPVLLTEGVLGWAARAYLDTRGPREPEPAPPRGPTAIDTRMDFTAPDSPPVPAAPRPRTRVRTAAAHMRSLADRLRITAPRPRRPARRTPADQGPQEGPPGGEPTREDTPAAERPVPPVGPAARNLRAGGGPAPAEAARHRSRRRAPGGTLRNPLGDTLRGSLGGAPRASLGGTLRGPFGAGSHRSGRGTAGREPLLVVGIVGACVVVPLLAWAVMGADGSDGGAAGTAEGAAGGTASSLPPWAGTAADASDGVLRSRLRNAGDGLCLDVRGGKADTGAEAVLAGCGPARTQRWAYEGDGLLRSLAAPSLCLDSRLGYSVVLAPCAGRSAHGAADVRYDFTAEGNLISRQDEDLALTPAAPGSDPDPGTALVLKPRATGDTEQRWQTGTEGAPHTRPVDRGAEGTPGDR